MGFIVDFLRALGAEVRTEKQTAIESRVAYGITSILALTFVAGIAGSVALKLLNRRSR